ncbi:glycoside hydrolase 5 family protein [Saccharothrix variisporea]|uniref:Arabinogalactan endo-beta-1,4-galactanase n=1 Tax=Saccharothrix variisporea TaxID=543527 RepID=A0A495XMT4_9PSEU|nr:hypothetical protein [Saccharothrix variisporea]RKT74224.1 hypothetical protein DFJ66_7567 [Saccharothrix variisporea]
MKFGIYPGGRAGVVCSHPADPRAIDRLVTELAQGQPFVIREYVHFFGRGGEERAEVEALGAGREFEQLTMPDDWYVTGDHELDLVVSYLPAEEDVEGWLEFLDTVIDRYGHLARYLQVTLEPNFPIPLIDGSSPGVLDALTAGLPHAKRALAERGITTTEVGFSVAEPAEWLGGDDAFWEHLARHQDLAAHVDYVGLGLYPDAFSPVPPEAVAPLTEHALTHLRRRCTEVGLHVPIHIAENGSPSGRPRTEEAQAASLATMLNTILANADRLDITHCELFSLRDADSGSSEAVGTLGLVTDTYEPKPAFATYKDVIATRCS